jgi:ribosome-binding factor A
MKEYPRSARLNTQLQHELSALLREGILRDPRLHDRILTVTAVETGRDLSSAQVLVSWLGDDAALDEAVKVLNRASGKIRHEIGERLRMRYVPTLHFVVDKGLREGDRVHALIRKAVADDKAAAADAEKAAAKKPATKKPKKS